MLTASHHVIAGSTGKAICLLPAQRYACVLALQPYRDWVDVNTGLDVLRITTPHFGSQTMVTGLVLITDITALCGLVTSLVRIMLFFQLCGTALTLFTFVC